MAAGILDESAATPGPGGGSYCVERVVPGTFGAPADTCTHVPVLPPFMSCYTCDHKDPSCGPEHGGEQLAQRYCRASRTEVPPSPPPPPPNPPIYRDPTSSWLQPHGSMGDPYVAWNAYGQPLSVRARPVLRQYLF